MRIIGIILTGLTFFSCISNDDDDDRIRTKVSIIEKDSLIIKVNDSINVQGYVQLISSDKGREFISSYQYINKENFFFLYDIESKSLIKTLNFKREGENGVGRVAPVMYFQDFNSILLYEINANRFHFTDSSGHRLRTLDLNNYVNGFIQFTPAFPSLILNGKLHFLVIADIDPNSKLFLKKSKPEGIFDLESNTYENTFPDYPLYPDGYLVSMENWKVSRCIGKDGVLVYSFPFNSSIFVQYDANTRKEFKVNNDDFFIHSNPPLISPMSMKSQMEFVSTVGMYAYILYDQYRNLYYRVFFPPSDLIGLSGNLIKIADKPFIIEIFDEGFNLVGKQSFQGGAFNPYSLLVSKRGILISKQSPYNPRDEEHFIYAIFAIQRITGKL